MEFGVKPFSNITFFGVKQKQLDQVCILGLYENLKLCVTTSVFNVTKYTQIGSYLLSVSTRLKRSILLLRHKALTEARLPRAKQLVELHNER